jgi:K+-sensing histidine kinase KdpD
VIDDGPAVSVDRERELVGAIVGVGGTIALAFALVTVRDDIINATAALVLVVPVLLGAVIGGRWAGFASAVVAAMSFDFFFTKPYLSLTIAGHDDVETTLVLLVVALLSAEIGIRGRRTLRRATVARSEVDRLYRVAEMAAGHADAGDVVLAVQAELIGLLDLDDCVYEAQPGATLPCLERNGAVAGATLRLAGSDFALPEDGVELPVAARGRAYGRFVLHPHSGVGVSLEQRRVAVALADQLALVLAVAGRPPRD